MSTTSAAATPVDEAVRADSDLRDLWRFYAHRMSDTALVACVSVSILLIAGFAVIALLRAHWAQHWWPLTLPPIFVGAFGAWGIADRELVERRRAAESWPVANRLLLGVEWASCLIAALAGAAAIIVFLRVAVGTWIS
jgi:hypothetical protein